MDRGLGGLLVEGVLLRREAVRIGIDDNALTRSVRSEVLARIRQGAYADWADWQSANPERRQELMAAAVVRLYGPATVLTHHSAVMAHGGPTWRLDLSNVHIAYRRANGRIHAGVAHHNGGRRADDIPRLGGGWLRSPTCAAVESTMRTRSVEIGVCLMSDFLHRGLTSLEQLQVMREEVGDQRGALTLRPAIALADARLESVGESRCWYWLKRADLPEIIPQYEVLDAHGSLIGRCDFAVPELRVLIEFDGREKYERYRKRGDSVADTVIRERRRESRIREATGWEIVRITWADLARPDLMVERILAASRLATA